MANTFSFGGISSSTYKCYVARSNFFDAPARDVTTVSVAGRNGDLHIDNGRFNSFIAKVYVYFTENMQTNLPNLVNKLNSLTGERNYSESAHIGFYRKAVFISAVEVDVSDRKKAALELSFYCRPEKYLTTGDTPVVIGAGNSATLTNTTLFPAKPKIIISGAGTVTIGSKTIVTTAQATTIDFDTMQAYNGTTNLNNATTFSEVVLPTGSTIVTNGVGVVSAITPRWWQL